MLKTVSSITNAIGALNYKGTWNASTNSPALASGVGTKGDYYVVSVAGTTSLNGISNWGVGDWVAFNGTAWQRVEGGADLNGVNLTATNSGVIGASTQVSGFSACKFTAVSPAGSYIQTTGPAGEGNYVHHTATTGDNVFMYFGTEASFATRGSISYNRAGGLTAYNTTSDYRAKDIIGSVKNTGATIDALKVYEGQMKGATQPRPMLVAHEAQEVAPYSVTGEKDAVNEDGTPKYQQIDVSSLVPLLIAEMQNMRSRIASLESEISTLKGV